MSAQNARPLGDMLALDLDLVEVDPQWEYPIAGVRGFGRGVFRRPPIMGAETSYALLNRIHESQLVMSRLKAFEGAVAVVPTEFDGFYLSKEFPTFRCNEEALLPGYLAHICRWPDFWAMLASLSKGIGARRERVHAEQLLTLRLQVPEIDQQRVALERLDRLQGHVTSVADLCERSTELGKALVVSIAARPDLDRETRIAGGWARRALGEVMHLASDRVKVAPTESYRNLGIYSFGRGVFEKPDIDGSMTSAAVLNRVRAGQFIYSRLFAFEGAYAYVTPAFDGYFVSNEFPSFDPDPDRLDARWLATYLRSAERWAELAGASKGLGVRRQRIPVEAILAYEVWLPPIEVQRSMVETIDAIDRASQARAENTKRVSALVPAVLNEVFAELS